MLADRGLVNSAHRNPPQSTTILDEGENDDNRPMSSAAAVFRLGLTPQARSDRLLSPLPSPPRSRISSGRKVSQQLDCLLKKDKRRVLSPLDRPKKPLDIPKLADNYKNPFLGPGPLERRKYEPTKKLDKKTSQWVRASQLSLLPATPAGPSATRRPHRVPVLGKVPPSIPAPEGYFRIFTEMKTVETTDASKNGHHLASLLPHRYTKKVPLYGTSPRMLLMMQKAPPSRLARLTVTPGVLPPIPQSTIKPSQVSEKSLSRFTRLPPAPSIVNDTVETPTSLPTSQPASRRSSTIKVRRKLRKKVQVAESQLQPISSSPHADISPVQTAPEPDTSNIVAGPPSHVQEEATKPAIPKLPDVELDANSELTGWETEPQPPSVVAPARQRLSEPVVQPAVSASQPVMETAPSSKPTPKSSVVDRPYKPRRPTPPKQVTVNLQQLLNKNKQVDSPIEPGSDGEAAREEEDEFVVFRGDDTTAEDTETSASTPKIPSRTSQYLGRHRQNSNDPVSVASGGEDERKKRRASVALAARKSIVRRTSKIDLEHMRRQRIAEGGPHRAGLEGEKAKEDFLSAMVKDLNVLGDDSKARYLALSEPIFKDKTLVAVEEMGAELAKMGWVTEQEIEYINRVFELVAGDHIDQSEFCVIAALAERMTLLDTNLRLSFSDTDFKKLERNIKQYRNLFSVNTSSEDGRMTYEDLKILLLSTGLPADSIEHVASLLNVASDEAAASGTTKQTAVGFLDFLTYVPFFSVLHDKIVADPFAEGGGSGEDVIKNLLADLKGRQKGGGAG
ncbi:uncharacterized protein SPPG_07294 [Spizellomyces punctatus DAOM BR117]|uniref:EF-hand domain-containing protein n=1 Tax=Spizellomyces punctatus (strain DAOM BR117) TaxID=645134 RepID=A0A0L0H9P0_SPIPD|nr:uncharacterized protein SPPG_07294 [Spizellomyces punctatus DAOM BR117]KNC97368.1 hypothetical protein SPPG_07294 [Spizellomyces punctatus DAOM BR117]|eukprot:XP_016605408.1 hypothetical protein SPPG_07294 [Spizellomyces punctatus DAOM BR117]